MLAQFAVRAPPDDILAVSLLGFPRPLVPLVVGQNEEDGIERILVAVRTGYFRLEVVAIAASWVGCCPSPGNSL